MTSKSSPIIVALFICTGLGMIWHIKILQQTIGNEKALQHAQILSQMALQLHSNNRQIISAKTPGVNALDFHTQIMVAGIKRIKQEIDNDIQIDVYSPFANKNKNLATFWALEAKQAAWEFLKNSKGTPFIEIKQSDSSSTLRYAVPVLMQDSCVDCHNTRANWSQHHWKANNVAGLIAVNIPITRPAPRDSEIIKSTIVAYTFVVLAVLLGIIFIIIKQKKYNDELTRLTTTDPLTGVFNKSELFTSLKRETEKVKRSGSSVCLIVFDIDGFKQINDTLGHIKADELLKTIGTFLPSLLRPFDIPCRFKADEFAIILPGCTAVAATRIAERIINRLHDTHPDVQLSVGVSLSDPNKPLDSNRLLENAIVNKISAKKFAESKIIS